MSIDDYIINVLAHVPSGFEADFGLKNAKVLTIFTMGKNEVHIKFTIEVEVFHQSPRAG